MAFQDFGQVGALFRVAATNAASGTSAASTSAGSTSSTGYRAAVTHFSGSSSVSASYTIESPAGTPIWQMVLSGANNGFVQNFDPPLVAASQGTAVVFKASGMAATNTASVNGSGFYYFNVT